MRDLPPSLPPTGRSHDGTFLKPPPNLQPLFVKLVCSASCIHRHKFCGHPPPPRRFLCFAQNLQQARSTSPIITPAGCVPMWSYISYAQPAIKTFHPLTPLSSLSSSTLKRPADPSRSVCYFLSLGNFFSSTRRWDYMFRATLAPHLFYFCISFFFRSGVDSPIGCN